MNKCMLFKKRALWMQVFMPLQLHVSMEQYQVYSNPRYKERNKSLCEKESNKTDDSPGLLVLPSGNYAPLLT